MQHDKGSGEQVYKQYEELGVETLPFSARFDDEKGGGQSTETIISYAKEMFKVGNLKIFSNLQGLLGEMRQYHRKDGKIVRKKDDIISAFHYGLMMKRHAAPMVSDYGQQYGLPRENDRNSFVPDYDPFIMG